MNQEPIPPEISSLLAGEPNDFIVKAKRANPPMVANVLLTTGLIFVTISAMVIVYNWWQIHTGNEIHFELNGVATVAGPGNLKPLIIPGIAFGFCMLLGLGLTGIGAYARFAEGGWHIGTPKRLIIYQKKRTRSINWEQFSGNIEVSGTDENGSISLQMRTGRMVRQKRGAERYVPDVISIIGIKNAFQIEPLLRKRISENDPTPTKTA